MLSRFLCDRCGACSCHLLCTSSVLNELYNHAGNRLIILSTFDPDIALLLRLKQPRFPVCFLTESAGPIKTPDPRRASLHHAIQWARAIHCWGIVTECWPVVHAPELVQWVRVLALNGALSELRSLILCAGEVGESLEAVDVRHCQQRQELRGVTTVPAREHFGGVNMRLPVQQACGCGCRLRRSCELHS